MIYESKQKQNGLPADLFFYEYFDQLLHKIG